MTFIWALNIWNDFTLKILYIRIHSSLILDREIDRRYCCDTQLGNLGVTFDLCFGFPCYICKMFILPKSYNFAASADIKVTKTFTYQV